MPKDKVLPIKEMAETVETLTRVAITCSVRRDVPGYGALEVSCIQAAQQFADALWKKD